MVALTVAGEAGGQPTGRITHPGRSGSLDEKFPGVGADDVIRHHPVITQVDIGSPFPYTRSGGMRMRDLPER